MCFSFSFFFLISYDSKNVLLYFFFPILFLLSFILSVSLPIFHYIPIYLFIFMHFFSFFHIVTIISFIIFPFSLHYLFIVLLFSFTLQYGFFSLILFPLFYQHCPYYYYLFLYLLFCFFLILLLLFMESSLSSYLPFLNAPLSLPLSSSALISPFLFPLSCRFPFSLLFFLSNKGQYFSFIPSSFFSFYSFIV